MRAGVLVGSLNVTARQHKKKRARHKKACVTTVKGAWHQNACRRFRVVDSRKHVLLYPSHWFFTFLVERRHFRLPSNSRRPVPISHSGWRSRGIRPPGVTPTRLVSRRSSVQLKMPKRDGAVRRAAARDASKDAVEEKSVSSSKVR